MKLDNIYIVGAGGIGGWLAQIMGKMAPADATLHLIDGDTFEEKNLDRQLCSQRDIGRNKARTLGSLIRNSRCSVSVIPEYLSGAQPIKYGSLLLGAVDNHAARLTMLNLADQFESRVILAGNEYWDAEAYYYEPDWLNGPLDPRNYYPNLLTDKEGDPLHTGCTGEIQESAPQLASANLSAAQMAAYLYQFWYMKRDEMPDDTMDHWPIHILSNFAKIHTLTIGDKRNAAA